LKIPKPNRVPTPASDMNPSNLDDSCGTCTRRRIGSGLATTVMKASQVERVMIRKRLLHTIWERPNSKLTRRWVNLFIDRHLNALQNCHSIPPKDTRLTVSKSCFEEHINILKVHLTGKRVELVFNLDEPGSTAWVDRKFRR
jgi:hypothetical protein